MTNDEKIKTNKELAQEIVKAWNNKLDDETQEEFEDRLKKKRKRNKYKYELTKIKQLLQQVKREKSSEKRQLQIIQILELNC